MSRTALASRQLLEDYYCRVDEFHVLDNSNYQT